MILREVCDLSFYRTKFVTESDEFEYLSLEFTLYIPMEAFFLILVF